VGSSSSTQSLRRVGAVSEGIDEIAQDILHRGDNGKVFIVEDTLELYTISLVV